MKNNFQREEKRFLHSKNALALIDNFTPPVLILASKALIILEVQFTKKVFIVTIKKVKVIYRVIKVISPAAVIVTPFQINRDKTIEPHIEAANPHHFALKEGDSVTIGFESTFEVFQSLVALLLPLALCAAAILLYPKFMAALGFGSRSLHKFLFSLAVFVITIVITQRLQKRTTAFIAPEVTAIV